MTIKKLYESMSEAEREIQFGRETENPLTSAFSSKRVVHAKLATTPIAPETVQHTWEEIMESAPRKGQWQAAYVHIPFCKTKCTYCQFFKNGTNQEEEDTYVDHLIKEIERDAAKPRLRDGLIHAVFIGGGTPTSLSSYNAKRLLSTLHNALPLANDCEFTLEGRVHDVTSDKMDVWLSYGVNRISLGVQSFQTHIRQQVGRIDTREVVLERLRKLKETGQCAVIIDLMYGLPDQTMKIWENDLKDLVDSGIDGADLYQLDVFEESDLQRMITLGKVSRAATTQEQACMFDFGSDYLEKRGYKKVNVRHWRRTNRERSLYNVMGKMGVPIFPFGSSSGGHIDSYSFMLRRTLQPYETFVSRGEKPIMFCAKRSPLQWIADAVTTEIEQGYILLETLVEKDSQLADLEWLFQLWEKRGLLSFNGVAYELTRAGAFWQVNLLQTIIECISYLLAGKKELRVDSVSQQDKVSHPSMHKGR